MESRAALCGWRVAAQPSAVALLHSLCQRHVRDACRPVLLASKSASWPPVPATHKLKTVSVGHELGCCCRMRGSCGHEEQRREGIRLGSTCLAPCNLFLFCSVFAQDAGEGYKSSKLVKPSPS